MRSRTASWFETKIRYDKTMEDGQNKKVIELYVVDALSFGEAEASITEEMSAMTGRFIHASAHLSSAFHTRPSLQTPKSILETISVPYSLLESQRLWRVMLDIAASLSQLTICCLVAVMTPLTSMD